MGARVNTRSAGPLLSILVPAYRYPEGVRRILRTLDTPGIGGRVEVLISDDSPDDTVQSAVQALAPSLALHVVYRRNTPPRGAVFNWNGLLDEARGCYAWLVHHDEFALGTDFLPRLLDALVAEDADVLLLDCVLVSDNNGATRRHLPMALRAAIARHAPGYLLRRNAIGPTACLVTRRDLYPRFDTRLRWLVDVEAYARLLRPGTVVRPCPTLRIGSIVHRSASITAQIGADLPRLHRAELDALPALLAGSHVAAWIGFAAGRGMGARGARALESVAWLALRAVLRAKAALRLDGVARAQALQSLGRGRA